MSRLERAFDDARGEWESRDGWQFADRDAERKFFFAEGGFLVREISEEFATYVTEDSAPFPVGEFIDRRLDDECP